MARAPPEAFAGSGAHRSDACGGRPAGVSPSAAAASRAPAERRAASQALRPKQAGRCLAGCEDAAILEDVGADILMEALGAPGCEYLAEPLRPDRSLRWSSPSALQLSRGQPLRSRPVGEGRGPRCG
ncbi:LOW QUALITY PROTEIN: probable crossover junction endonuclease EME2 [Manis pentadactyla]|uniref:LOW QUALITY PROTEIN: probable crossover junction endonuclease EME2 n=1 Tax=Manis pentadactyla TaxID=143292 RepID=UPI00255CCD1C|nr:LOW QUALITY PROTEIN: probable crossover junction endonuclease EME2 [Manis pentadactyla]